jgi:hypothetical protein
MHSLTPELTQRAYAVNACRAVHSDSGVMLDDEAQLGQLVLRATASLAFALISSSIDLDFFFELIVCYLTRRNWDRSYKYFFDRNRRVDAEFFKILD